MSDSDSGTAAAWQRLSDALGLAERLRSEAGAVLVTASDIKRLTGREPRLMTKFDTREGRPKVLADATILPVTNGQYAVLAGDGYATVPTAWRARSWEVPSAAKRLTTLPWLAGPSSESQAIDMAHASGILDDFLNEATRLTIRGRLRSPRFEFTFASARGDVALAADGVQIEVDSGYEGEAVHLVEAKLGTRSNFHVRQLFYPFRMWQSLLPERAVNAVFLSWHNRCLQLRRFGFDEPTRYHGLRCTAAVDYYVDRPTPLPSLAEVLATTPVEATEAAPFPQADDLRRVIDVVDAVAARVTSRAGIALRYDFDARQADYYASAAAYLGFLRRSGREFELTPLGGTFTVSTLSERLALVLRQLAARPVFRSALEFAESSASTPGIEQVADWVAASAKLSGQTPRRRARTVLSWTKWALDTAASRDGIGTAT